MKNSGYQKKNNEIQEIAEHMQMIAGCGRVFAVEWYDVIFDGKCIREKVYISKMPKEKVESVVSDISAAIYGKFSRSVFMSGNKLVVSSPH